MKDVKLINGSTIKVSNDSFIYSSKLSSLIKKLKIRHDEESYAKKVALLFYTSTNCQQKHPVAMNFLYERYLRKELENE
jgi:hypothetical protein